MRQFIINVLVIIILVLGILKAAALYRAEEKGAGIELTKADCIETCIEVIQRESVFPKGYHEIVQRCNDMFANVETCMMTAAKGR